MRSGEKRLKQAIARARQRDNGTPGDPSPVGEMPKPDDPWGAWVEFRLERLEDRQTWLTRLILAALVMQVALKVLEMLP